MLVLCLSILAGLALCSAAILSALRPSWRHIKLARFNLYMVASLLLFVASIHDQPVLYAAIMGPTLLASYVGMGVESGLLRMPGLNSQVRQLR